VCRQPGDAATASHRRGLLDLSPRSEPWSSPFFLLGNPQVRADTVALWRRGSSGELFSTVLPHLIPRRDDVVAPSSVICPCDDRSDSVEEVSSRIVANRDGGFKGSAQRLGE
jgi:hypothetical protein